MRPSPATKATHSQCRTLARKPHTLPQTEQQMENRGQAGLSEAAAGAVAGTAAGCRAAARAARRRRQGCRGVIVRRVGRPRATSAAWRRVYMKSEPRSMVSRYLRPRATAARCAVQNTRRARQPTGQRPAPAALPGRSPPTAGLACSIRWSFHRELQSLI